MLESSTEWSVHFRVGSDLIPFYWQERMGAPGTSISVEGRTITGDIMITFTSWRIMGKCVTRTPCCLLLFCCRYKSDTPMSNLRGLEL